MEKRQSYFVSPKNGLTWLMALFLLGSAVARIVVFGEKGAADTFYLWSQILLPIGACLIYVLITLLDGRERFYRTAIPMWMIAVYFCFAITEYGFGMMVNSLFATCLLFYALSYQWISSGKTKAVILLLPLQLAPLCAVLYLRRGELLAGSFTPSLPNLLMMAGLILTIFAIRPHPAGTYHPTWGDRSDGRRIRSLPPMSQVSPYIMVTRNTSVNYFADSFEITAAERYIRQKRKEGFTNFGLNHVLLAAYARSVAKYPALNRFVAGQKVYSRGNDLQYCMTIKKEMSLSSPDTVIKVHLSPYDTAEDVYRKFNEEVEKVKSTPLDSSFDATAQIFTFIPGLFLKFVVWLLKTMDYFGLLPKFLLEVSPFHGSVFFTSMGSLGIPPIYHHLYDFGNLPVFGSFGCKRRVCELTDDGTLVQRKYIDMNFTLDERIADGYYYAAVMKYFKRLISRPEILDLPPEEVLSDID